jgi:hypothetical protein
LPVGLGVDGDAVAGRAADAKASGMQGVGVASEHLLGPCRGAGSVDRLINGNVAEHDAAARGRLDLVSLGDVDGLEGLAAGDEPSGLEHSRHAVDGRRLAV